MLHVYVPKSALVTLVTLSCDVVPSLAVTRLASTGLPARNQEKVKVVVPTQSLPVQVSVRGFPILRSGSKGVTPTVGGAGQWISGVGRAKDSQSVGIRLELDHTALHSYTAYMHTHTRTPGTHQIFLPCIHLTLHLQSSCCLVCVCGPITVHVATLTRHHCSTVQHSHTVESDSAVHFHEAGGRGLCHQGLVPNGVRGIHSRQLDGDGCLRKATGKASEGNIITSSSRHLSSAQSIDGGSWSDCISRAETSPHGLVMVCACHTSYYTEQ